MDEIYVKAFVAFIVGALVYNLIDSMKLCNKNIVEGQETTSQDGAVHASVLEQNLRAGTVSATGERVAKQDSEMVVSLDSITIPASEYPNLKDPIRDAQEILNKPIKTTITKLKTALNSINNEIPEVPDSINTISNFYLLGETPNALDYFELLVRAVTKLTKDEFHKFVENLGKTDYCNNSYDLNTYIMSIMLLKYTKNLEPDQQQNYIIISNRLSKYIPDILEKIQTLNESCLPSADKLIKSKILDTIIYKLFKNNKTVVNFNGIGDLMKNLENVKTIYIVLFMICFTYIIVKFMGMFAMKVNM